MIIVKSLIAAVLLGCLGSAALAADIVVIGHPSAEAMTKERIADLYLGKSHTATLYDHRESSALYADFYQQATGRDVAQVKSTWSRIVFSGRGQAPKQLADSAAVKKAVADNPKAIGYIERAALDNTVKVILELK